MVGVWDQREPPLGVDIGVGPHMAGGEVAPGGDVRVRAGRCAAGTHSDTPRALREGWCGALGAWG